MYANGRAKGPGRWYRSGLQVKRPSGVKPLPFSLQILPMRMTPTSRNPGCATTATQYGAQVAMEAWDTRAFIAGRSLSRSPARWQVALGNGRKFFTDDGLHAVAWVRAANHIRHRIGAVLTDTQ